MKSFKEILNESSISSGNQYNSSIKIIKFLEKKLGEEYIDFDGQNYTNNEGNFFGYLFLSKNDTSAIRINWEGNKFNSINFWQSWNYNTDPTIEIKISKLAPGDNAFTRLLPDIADIIADNNKFEDEEETVNESLLMETGKFEYNGEIYNGKPAVIKKMYDEEKTLEDIKNTVGVSPTYIKTIIANYIKDNGGSVSDVANVLNISNIVARQLCGEKIDDEGNIAYNPAIKVIDGLKETVTPSKALKKMQEILEETEYSDPDLVFDEISDYVTLVAKGVIHSLLISGQDGIGKSYNVDKILDQYGKKQDTWVKFKGKVTPLSIYETLWNNRNKIIVFEDCDEIFKDADSLNVLKEALNFNETKDITWHKNDEDMVNTSNLDDNSEIEQKLQDWSDENKGKEALPNHFIFEGSIILISNLKKSEIYKKDADILTHCTCIDIVLSAKDIVKRLETILSHIKFYKNIGIHGNDVKDITDQDIKQEIFNFIKSDEYMKNPSNRGKEISLYNLEKIYKLKHAGLEDWKERTFKSI